MNVNGVFIKFDKSINRTYWVHDLLAFGEDIASDLEQMGEELVSDTEAVLAETHPATFDFDEWKRLREAIKTMRENLDEVERILDEAEDAALEYDADAEEETQYESEWD